MKYVHTVHCSVFVKPEEIQESPKIRSAISTALQELTGLDFAQEKLAVTTTKVEGFNNRAIEIFTVVLAKEAHTNHFLEHLCAALNQDQKELLWEQKESRLDDELNFYIRLGKKELLRGKYDITDSGDCVHIKMHIAAFPKKREAALDVVRKIFA